ncbi:MAG: fibronectin type III-like domain-contianing protein [Eubacteriales bacterium]|nr:fibronectin type III-like domain-contianing protein [Eubacteriales bacterium]
MLKPGETQEMILSVSKEQLASYDDSGVSGHRFCYVMEPGDYVFYIGENVREAQL